MGIFPIAMNILQFWLIDSIVKASSTPSAVALGVDSADPFHTSDREPLFNASDDEDEDDHRPRRLQRDIENQLPSAPSQSSSGPDSYSTGGTVVDETEAMKKDDAQSISGRQHSYPPSLSGSIGSLRSGPVTDGSKGPQRKSSLPTDNHPKVEQLYKPTTQNTHAPKQSEDWGASWDDDEDAWDEQGNAGEVQGQEHDRTAPIPPTSRRERRLS